jgi:hypothetical protein
MTTFTTQDREDAERKPMNANDLAVQLDAASSEMEYNHVVSDWKLLSDAATMLRQQQAEIEALRMGFAGNGTSDSELAEVRAMANRWFLEIQALKQVIDANNLIQNIGQFVKPANEPVAWGWYDLEIKRFFPHWDEDLMENKEGCIPLYTHPAKTLTDEEINALSEEHLDMDWQTGVIDFARAILRKAQEK